MEPKFPKPPKQYAPIGFGEPFNPNSVEGHERRQRQAAAIRSRKEREAEDAAWEAQNAVEKARIAARSPLGKLWDRLRSR